MEPQGKQAASLKPIVVERFEVDGVTYEMREPRVLPVSQEGDCLVAEDRELGVDAYGATREELEAMVHDSLASQWKWLAQEKEMRVALGSREIRRAIKREMRCLG